MLPQAALLEQRLMDLEAQIERASDALLRLSDIEGRLQRDAAWREMREHTESLAEICVNTAGSTQTGLERAEARLAKLEHDLHRRLDDLSRDLRAVAAQLVEPGVAIVRGPASSWSLDEVTRLHQELRDSAASDPSPIRRDDRATRAAPATLALGRASVDVESDHDHSVEPIETPPASRSRWMVYAGVVLLAAVAASAGGVAVAFYRKAKTAAEQAVETERRAELIAAAGTERLETARREAAAQIADARDAATKARVTTEILAAPDLARFNLTGADGTGRAAAQLLWSRTRGLVFSGSRLPQPPANTVYQIWLLMTAGEAVSAGTMTPDSSGRVTLATERPPELPRPVVGVQVTLEPSPGGRVPSGAPVLARVP